MIKKYGAGKTTLMKLLVTLLNRNSGEIEVCGIPINNTGEIRKITGYLPQEFSMYPSMTVCEAMDYLGVLSGLDAPTRKKRIPLLLEKVNLQNDYKTKVKALSGGMKRRLGIAQAILHEPRVLIVDEPTAGLDPEERIRFRNLLCDIAENKIVILSTHIVGDIEATCENIAVLDSGKLLYKGNSLEFAKIAEKKVYSGEVKRSELPLLKSKYIVTGSLSVGDKVNVRVIAGEKPFHNAVLCDPGIEDAYMLKMHESGVEKNKLGGGQ